MLVGIISLSPWLYFSSRKSQYFPKFYGYARLWSAWILNGMFLSRKIKREAEIQWDRPYVVVSNHASELDVMLCYQLVESPTVFIGKKELSNIPLFGFFFRRSSIIVDRKSLASKKKVMELSALHLQNGRGMCIYPEGEIPDGQNVLLGEFKHGAFKLAIENNIDILPITFANNREHLPDFFKGGRPGTIHATIHKPISVKGLTKSDTKPLSDKVHSVLLNELNFYRKIL